MKAKTTLITGGAGFIGSALARIFAGKGDQVIVLDKLTYAGHLQNLEGVDCTFIEGDICDAELLAKIFTEHSIDLVIHAAAESHVDNSISVPGAFIQANVVGTQIILEAARAAWNKKSSEDRAAFRYVQISTDEVYGTLGASGEFTTETRMRPNSPYAASKAAADLLVRAWHQTYGLPVMTTRCCNNYGPRQHPEKLIPLMISHALASKKLPVYGDGKQVREWIHVDDHARGVLAVAERGIPGNIYHLGSNEECENIALVHRLCDLLAAVKPGQDYHKLITHVMDRAGHDFRYALDVSETEKLLGFTPQVSFAEGIESTVAWYLNNGAWVETMRAWRGK